MHKALRLKVRKVKAIERKIQELAFTGKSEARQERAKMIENRHWYNRDLKKVKAAKEAGRPIKGLDDETIAALQTLHA